MYSRPLLLKFIVTGNQIEDCALVYSDQIEFRKARAVAVVTCTVGSATVNFGCQTKIHNYRVEQNTASYSTGSQGETQLDVGFPWRVYS